MVLRHDAIGPLLEVADPALAWAVGHDIMGEPLAPQTLWSLPEVLGAARSQHSDGSWSYHGGNARIRSRENYAQVATYRQLLTLVSIFRLDRRHSSLAAAAEFLLGFQTGEGDIRGIYGTQYTPNYTADILRLLVEAGYEGDSRVAKGIGWLLSVRQDDGGWAIPVRTQGRLAFARAMRLRHAVEPDRAKPSSHLVTGIVLRALAAHPAYRHRAEARHAARLLASRFFEADRYADRGSPSYWAKLAFPFRWTDLASSLDAASKVGLHADEPGVAVGLRWLHAHQRPDGLWSCGYRLSSDVLRDHWVSFAVARMLKRFHDVEALFGPGHARPHARVQASA